MNPSNIFLFSYYSIIFSGGSNMVRLRCKKCHRRVTIKPVYSRDNRWVIFRCPNFKCNAEGVFKNKNYIPFLFVKKISLVSRQQFFAVLNPTHRKMGDARIGFKPPMNYSKKNSSAEHRKPNHNILKGVA